MSEPKLVTDWKAMCRDRDKDINRLDKSLTGLKKKVSDIFEDNCKLEKQIVAEQSRSAKMLERLEWAIEKLKGLARRGLYVEGWVVADDVIAEYKDAEKGE